MLWEYSSLLVPPQGNLGEPPPPSDPHFIFIFLTDLQVGAFFRSLHASSPREVEASLAFTHIPLPADGDKADVSTSEAAVTALPLEEQPVIILSCVGFLPAGTPALDACYDTIRAFAATVGDDGKRCLAVPLHDAPETPYAEALSSLDSSWSWPGLCLYGHGTFVPETHFDKGLVTVGLKNCAVGEGVISWAAQVKRMHFYGMGRKDEALM